MSEKKEPKSDYIKKDGKINFKKLDRDIHYAVLMMRVVTLLLNPSIRWIEFFAYAIVGAGWMSLLMIFIWTGNLLLLKIWATPIAAALILMCIIEGIKALRKKREGILELMNKYERKEYQMSKEDFIKLKNSLDSFNDYEKNVDKLKVEIPTYKEYREYVLGLKPELISHENLIKVWYGMFEQSKWTIAGFNVQDWKLQTNTIIKVFLCESLDNYINFYSKENKNENGTDKV